MRLARVAIVVSAAIGSIGWGPSVGAAAASGWALQALPAPIQSNGQLLAVSCPAWNACIAVGSFVSSIGFSASAALVERWDGAKWSLESTPAPVGAESSTLDAVSCTSPRACTAVGWFTTRDHTGLNRTLAERWSGSRWSIVRTSAPSSSVGAMLNGVSCPSPGVCVAVGVNYPGAPRGGPFPPTRVTAIAHRGGPRRSGVMTLVGRLNGSKWSILRAHSATPGTLTGVSCVSSSSCAAVGSVDKVRHGSTITVAFAEHWRGSRRTTRWSPAAAARAPSSLNAVSCLSARICTAVGWVTVRTKAGQTNELPVAERWNGSGWSRQSSASRRNLESSGGAVLNAVACSSSAECVAVGSRVLGLTLIERWNGLTWSVVHALDPPGGVNDGLNGVACPTATTCAAVGSTGTVDGYIRTLPEHLDRSRWSIDRSVNPRRATTSELNAVSCASRTMCTAVGDFDAAPPLTLPLAERWTGSRWSIQRMPVPRSRSGSPLGILRGISCPSPTACSTVGVFAENAVMGRALVERWSGAKWFIQTAPVPSRNDDSQLNAISCPSSTDCTAVGSYAVGTDTSTIMIEHWNGVVWSIQSDSTPADAISSYLRGVSCPSARSCTAVGDYTVNGDLTGWIDRPLVEHWDGTSWSVQQPPLPAGSAQASLTGVSCTSPTACTAVGSSPGTSDSQILAERWDGQTWSIQLNANPPGAQYSWLNAVSCSSATLCTTAGFFTKMPGARERTLAEVWHGADWSVQDPSDPGRSTLGPNATSGPNTVLSGVACTSDSACIAVGSSTNDDDTSPPFAERLG
jgi:hypothetical protein